MPFVSFAETLLTTVTKVKLFLGTDGEFSDELIEEGIKVVSRLVEEELGMELGYRSTPEDEPEFYRGMGYSKLYLDRSPLVSVEEVRIFGYGDVDGEVDVEDEDWSVGNNPDSLSMLFRPSGWPRSIGNFPDIVRAPDASSSGANISVAYSAGFWLPSYDADDTDAWPDGKPSGVKNLPSHLEALVYSEVIAWLNGQIGQTNRDRNLVEETTPGGWRQKWESSKGKQTLSDDTLITLRKSPYYRVYV